MHKVTKTLIVIYDNYNNILAVQRGKEGSPESWSIVGKELKGKESTEKCIAKAVDKDLGCTIFNLAPFKEYIISEENKESLLVYSGVIREQITCHKTINKAKWINRREIDKYDFSIMDKEILSDFLKNID